MLLDELGSATDPEEGAALAVAVVAALPPRTRVELHHHAPHLAQGLRRKQRRRPQRRRRLRSGDTHAHLPASPRRPRSIRRPQHRRAPRPLAEIIAAARSQLSTQTADIAAFLDRLHQQLAAVTEERETLKQREQELQRERIRLDLEGRAEIKGAHQGAREASSTRSSNDFEYQLRETVKAIDDKAVAKKIQRDSATTISRARREFGQAVQVHRRRAHDRRRQERPQRAAAHRQGHQASAIW